MMNQTLTLPYYSGAHFSAIQLPFKEQNYSMLYILPDADSDLPQLEMNLHNNSTFFTEILQNNKNKELDIFIPRFGVRWTAEMKDHLVKCGINDLFNYIECDLSGECND